MKAPALGRGGRPLRIAYGRLFHEANAFSPTPTPLRDFETFQLLRGDEVARAASLGGAELAAFMPHAELTGFLQAARLAGGVEALPLLSAMAVPGGPLERACFDELLGELVDRLRDAGPVDGVYLALHGSMQVHDLVGPPEAEILRRVREVVGPAAKIAASFDLHGNLTSEVVDALDVLIAYRSNPHWDLAPTGFRAGNRLIRALRGQCRPVSAWRKLPLVLGGGTTISFLSPMRQVFRYLRDLERDPRVLSASLFMVHPYTSAADLGWAVHVTTDGDEALAEQLAERLADRVWEVRKVDIPRSVTIAEALDEVARSPWRRLGPVTLVDAGDVVGAGAPGGNTRIVQALARDGRGLRAFVPVHDPALVAETWELPIGARRSVVLRGTPGYGAPEVPLEVVVAARTTGEFGRIVRLDAGSTHLAVAEGPALPVHPSFWTALGLRARDADLIVQKNFFHYRMFYATTSFHHVLVRSDGATSLERVRDLPYRVPTHPGTPLDDWRSGDRELRRRLVASSGTCPETAAQA